MYRSIADDYIINDFMEHYWFLADTITVITDAEKRDVNHTDEWQIFVTRRENSNN